MRHYETLYLVDPNLADEDLKDVVDKFNKVIEKNSGIVTKVDEWGKRQLAYKVKKFEKGYYVLLQYCGGPQISTELQRLLKLDDRILKYQTIKLNDDVDPTTLKQEAQTDDQTKVEDAVEPGDMISEEDTQNGV